MDKQQRPKEFAQKNILAKFSFIQQLTENKSFPYRADIFPFPQFGLFKKV